MASAHLLTPTALRSKSPRPASGTGQAYPAYHEPNASRWQRDAARKRILSEQWTSHAYSLALKRASRKAGVPAITAYQIRHLGKNELTRAYGIEVARLLLGHEKTDTTDLYGGRDYQLLTNAMASKQ